MISFNQIPVNVLTPGSFVELDASRANTSAPKPRNRTLVVGQKIAAGTAVNNTLYRINSVAEAKQLFGRGSMIALMLEAYRAGNNSRELWALALNDAGGSVAATATVTVNSGPSANGTIKMQVCGEPIDVAVAAGDSATVVAAAIAAAINANLDLPVTATSAAAVVTLTARNKGTIGNGLDIRWSYYQGQILPTGMGLTFTGFSAGATDPLMADAFTAIGDEPFATLVTPYTDATNMTATKTNLAAMADGMVMNDCMAYTAFQGALAAVQTFLALHNSPFICVLPVKASPTPIFEVAAALAAQADFSNDDDPGRPQNGLALKLVLPPKEDDRFERTERNFILTDGGSTYRVDIDGNMTIERLVTTYKANAQGFADTAYKSLNAVLTLFYLRWSVRYRIATKYPRHKLGDDGGRYSPNQAIVTPKTLRAELISLCREWEELALVENVSQFIADIVVERNVSDRNRIDAILPPDLINQFHVFAAQVQFRN